MEDKQNKDITGNEFVEEMKKLGYNIEHSDNPINKNFYILLSLAKQIEELKKK